VRQLIQRVEPDLIHAMRIPFEGMLAAAANPPASLIISVWGNDFTLHAKKTPVMGYLTRRALLRADALHLDCERDRRLAHGRGFSTNKPTFISPGAGGVRPEIFHPGEPNLSDMGEQVVNELQAIPPESMVVVNPRGFRAYVRNDTFFHAIPMILAEMPDVRFLCPAMDGESQAIDWVDQLNISHAVRLLPKLRPKELAAVFQRSQVTVSPTEHDGTPNSLLEGMACGSFPIAGDLESIREWIEEGVNGLLIDPGDPAALASAVVQALSNANLREVVSERNQQLIRSRAMYPNTMAEAESFYRQVAV
jgi:glycosyltransferase involved in cell wall biosynthesis